MLCDGGRLALMMCLRLWEIGAEVHCPGTRQSRYLRALKMQVLQIHIRKSARLFLDLRT